MIGGIGLSGGSDKRNISIEDMLQWMFRNTEIN